MDLSPQLCVAESSTKPTGLPPVRLLDLGRNLSFSLAHLFLNGLLGVEGGDESIRVTDRRDAGGLLGRVHLVTAAWPRDRRYQWPPRAHRSSDLATYRPKAAWGPDP